MAMSPGANVAWSKQRLHRHFVGCRRAIGDKEDVIGPEGAGCHVLRTLNVAGWLQKAVESAGCCAALGEEQIDAVELAHVADPIGLEDRFTARDRKCVKGADGTARIALEIVEEGRFVSRLHALQDGQMDLERLLDGVEDAAHAISSRIARELLDATVGEQKDVELGADSLQGSGESEC